MPWIEITNEAHEAFMRNGVSTYAEKHRTASGWRIPLKWETLERLKKHKFKGESFSDVIVRISTFSDVIVRILTKPS